MGLLDDIADVATGKKTKEETVSYQQAANNPDSQEAQWMNNSQTAQNINQAWSNAENMAADPDFQTEKQKEVEEAKKAAKVVKTTEKKVVTDPEVKTKKKFTIPGLPMKVDKRLHNLYQSLLSRGYEPKDARKIIELGLTEEQWADENLIDLMSGEGIKRLVTKDFGASKKYEHEFLGSAGAANILNQLEKIKGKTDKETAQLKQNYVNQIIEANPEGAEKMGLSNYQVDSPSGWNISPEIFKQKLVDANQGNKNFDKNYHETAGAYWELHPPQTSGAMEDMANAYQQGNLEMTKQNTLAIQNAVDAKSKGQGLASLGGGGGGGGGTQPVDPADPDAGLMPSGTYLASQYNQALVPDPNLDPYQNAMYTGGPEQQHLAGGYWDPDKQEWVGSPWGTQNLWQGANPPTTGVVGLAEGGPVRAPSSKVTIGGGGLFDFKPYGF